MADRDDEFFQEMKSKSERDKEWTDAAQFYVDVRREKTAGLRDVAQAMYGMASKVDGSGIVDALGSKGGRIAALGGAALFGIGTALASRGKKELGGKSQVEHEMAQEKAERHSKPEPEGFGRKLLNNVSDFNADLASTARKHPVKAGLVGALGGAKAGVEIHKLLGKLK